MGSSVTSLSWIPSEAITGMGRLAFDAGITHYDEPPPDRVDDLEALRAGDRFRFANRLGAWIEVDGGAVTEYGYDGGVLMGSTNVRVGGARATFQPFAMPIIQRPPEVVVGSVRFVQTCGGRTGLPAPRTVRRKPYVQFRAPLTWTTLSLTLHADGRADWEVVGASPFPRHWIYGPDGALAAKVGLTNFDLWWRRAFGKHSPWGDEDSEVLVTEAETALERELSTLIMRGGPKPVIRTIDAGATLTQEGEAETDVFLLLDGVLRVEIAGERIAEIGPGALVGERAILEGGRRTSTLVAVTACRVAVAGAETFDRSKLIEVSSGHRREQGS
jgi:hypothetical protein